VTIAFLVPRYLPRVHRLFPAQVMALIVGTAASMLLMPNSDAPILGEIHTSLLDPQIPTMTLALAASMIVSALMLSAKVSVRWFTRHQRYHAHRRQHPRLEVEGRKGRHPCLVPCMPWFCLPSSSGQGSLASHILKAVLAGILVKARCRHHRLGLPQTYQNDPRAAVSMTEHEIAILQEAQGKILLYHVNGPLSFGAARGMVRRLAQFRQFNVLVVDPTDVPVTESVFRKNRTAVRSIDLDPEICRPERDIRL